MPLPLAIPVILSATTIASLASPFFLPKTEQEKATIELNNKLSEGNFTIVKTQPEIKTPDFKSKIKSQVSEVKQIFSENKEIGFVILAIIAVVILMVVS
ncbi:MAG TPA: hypothetical protein VLE02_02735 [Nitrosarchaeum sp.]|nr:hypothetical protein [Nitrosarchaeum sp.]